MKLKKYFIPHSENDYKPHVFRELSVLVILFITVLIFASSIGIPALLKSTQFAEIYSSLLVDLTNKDRQVTANLPVLTTNPVLTQAAQLKAQDMAAKGYFAHTSPEGLTPWYFMTKAGYPYLYAGENLAVDFTDSTDVEVAWMNSPLHKANILGNHFTEIGIATAKGMLNGKETTFVVQFFGSPRPIATLATTIVDSNVASQPATVIPPKETTTPTPKPAVTPKPKVSTQLAANANLETVSSTPLFLEVRVKGESISPSTTIAVATATAVSSTEPVNSNWFERLLGNPVHTARTLYYALAAFVLLSLLLFVFIKWQVQHPKNISYALLILVIIISAIFIQWFAFAPAVGIV